MRVVALISGGKDSCYNMMKCVAAGHEIVALANLQPLQGDELDSFMFQTVGHEGVSLIAEAMGIRLYRTFTRGKSLTRSLVYTPTDGDEVEELYELLVRVCEECEGVGGVASGAVLSDYQRLRVENVCSRLGLVSLSYLWRRDQEELLREMIDNGVQAIVIKVASMGLHPDKHLGRTIEDLYSDLCQLNRAYGVNVCGEGGEYETFTLDCPLYKKRIKLLESEVVVTTTDPYAPVGYLRLTGLTLEERESTPLSLPASTKRCIVPSAPPSLALSGERQLQCVQNDDFVWLAVDGDPSKPTIVAQSKQLFEEVWSQLSGQGSELCDAVLVYLYLSDMSNYDCVNIVYKSHFDSKPPARVCVSLPLPEGILVRLEVMLWVCGSGRSSMHVQSLSEWAPANIGPYSQAYTVSDIVFCAGQIGLEPSLMTLAPPLSQASLSLTHALSVLEACGSQLSRVLCGVCYCTSEEAEWLARSTWSKASKQLGLSPFCPLLFLRVLGLPKEAGVEWHFITCKTTSAVSYSCSEVSGPPPDSCSEVSGSPDSCSEVSGPPPDSCSEVGGPPPDSYSEVSGSPELVSGAKIKSAVMEDNRTGCWTLTTHTDECGLVNDVLQFCLVQLSAQLLSDCQLSLSELSCLRIGLPQYASSATSVQEIAKLCSECAGGGEVPLSVVTTRGYMGQNHELFVQACRFV